MTNTNTNKPAGEKFLDAIFGVKGEGDGLSDAERARNAQAAVFEAERAERRAAQRAADSERAAAEQAKVDAKTAVKAKADAIARRVLKASNVLVAEGAVQCYATVEAFRGGYRGSSTLVNACEILAGEPEACDDRVEDIVAECYGLL